MEPAGAQESILVPKYSQPEMYLKHYISWHASQHRQEKQEDIIWLCIKFWLHNILKQHWKVCLQS